MSDLNEELIKRLQEVNWDDEEGLYTDEALQVYKFIQEEMTDHQRKQLFMKYNDSWQDEDEVRMQDFWDWLEMLDSDEIEDLVKDLPEFDYKDESKKEESTKYNTKSEKEYGSKEEYNSAIEDDYDTLISAIEGLKKKVNTDQAVFFLDRVKEYLNESFEGIKKESKNKINEAKPASFNSAPYLDKFEEVKNKINELISKELPEFEISESTVDCYGWSDEKTDHTTFTVEIKKDDLKESKNKINEAEDIEKPEEVKEDDIEEDKEENTGKEFEVVDIEGNEDKLNELKEGSAFTFEGFADDDKNYQMVVDFFKENTKIKLPIIIYKWTGKFMNEMYGLTGSNAYPKDLHFVAIALDNWEEMGDLPIIKFHVGARWLDDIVYNNARRENKDEDEDEDEEE